MNSNLKMKKLNLVSFVCCFLLFGCTNSTEKVEQKASLQKEEVEKKKIEEEVEFTEILTTEAKTSQEMSSEGYKRYGVESGIIETELTGFQKGTETIYFDNWGMREAKYSHTIMTMAGNKREAKIFTLIDGEWIYNIDLDTNKGTKIKNPMIKSIAEQTGQKDFMQLGEKVLEKMGATKVGTEEVLGRTCDVWAAQAMSMRLLVWKGIPFKTTINIGEQIGQTINNEILVTKFEEGASISEDKFKLPEGATFSNVQLDMKAVKEMMGGNLK